jgi:hypothetical protein
MLAGIGIGLATQMAFSLWRSHRHSLQLARYDDKAIIPPIVARNGTYCAAPWRNCSMNSRGVASL